MCSSQKQLQLKSPRTQEKQKKIQKATAVPDIKNNVKMSEVKAQFS